MENVRFSVSDFIAVCNQTLDFAYPAVEIEGEVASFKINQGKYVFFDIKDANGSIGCFMTVWQLRIPIEDGMKVIITGQPKLTQWGKFSITVRAVRPSGEGALKKSFELLKAKLEGEGIFSEDRKRVLPSVPAHVGVISSTQAAGYGDFIKIVNERWGGMRIEVAHVQVQGEAAPDQIIRAIQYFNSQSEPPQVLVIIRGGGSVDDLSAFNDEQLVRAIAASRVPTLVGVGHEVDVTLADLAADVRAATPSNAAQILVPDRSGMIDGMWQRVSKAGVHVEYRINNYIQELAQRLDGAIRGYERAVIERLDNLARQRQLLQSYNPQQVLRRGYALLRGEARVGARLEIETRQHIIQAEVSDVREK